MFRNLLSFWKGRHFLDEVYNEFRQMLEDAERMFVMVCDALLRNSNKPDLMQKVHDADKGINKLHREVRKRIIEHLTLQPAVDVSVCLILMSLVKDGERLGDYCKNLCEVAELLDERRAKAWKAGRHAVQQQ
ncbi:MAG: PhoU domain-containing protein [Phycisphaerales bacterium]|nr:MAG: PhoU domain-containing protein [Phycisphaerales bacterium]